MSELNFALPTAEGGINWKDEKDEPGVDTKSLVDHRFALVQDMIDSATEDFEDSIITMRNTLTPIVVNDISTSGINAGDVAVDIPDFTGAFTATFTATLEDFDVTYTEPAGKPDAGEFVWEDGTFSLQQELVDKLAVWLLNGESAIPEALFNDIYAVAVGRLEEQKTAELLKLEADAAARGWACPQEVIDAQRMQVTAEYAKGATEISVGLAQKNMELIQANFHKAAEVAAQYVQVQMDYNIRKNLAKIEWYSTAVDAWIKQVQAEISVIEAKVAAFAGKVEAFKAKAAVYKTEADVFDSTVKAYIAVVEGLKSKISAAVESIKAQVMVFEVDSKVEIENEKLRVEAQIANNELGQRIAEAQSNFYAQLMASGMGALHVQAGVSANHSTGEQVGFSYSYGHSYAEQQSRSEVMSITREVE